MTLTNSSRKDHLLRWTTENTSEQKLEKKKKIPSARYTRHIRIRQMAKTHLENQNFKLAPSWNKGPKSSGDEQIKLDLITIHLQSLKGI